jgi:GGDEF-like domain
LGIERARDGVPLASVMEAYRVGFRAVWDAAVQESEARVDHDGRALSVLTAKIFAAQDIFTNAMARAYRDEQSRRALTDESERSVLIDSVLHGRLFEQSSVWEAADYLRLPSEGPYVIIAAAVPAVGAEALPEIESKLRSMDVFSAWRVLPDLHVGIVHIKTDKQLGNALSLVSRVATNRVGVSPRFDDLRETAQALRFARVMLRGRADPGLQVTSFDGSILGTAAISAPEIMVKLVTPTIERFAGLADNERDILFDTFRVWLENDDTTSPRRWCSTEHCRRQRARTKVTVASASRRKGVRRYTVNAPTLFYPTTTPGHRAETIRWTVKRAGDGLWTPSPWSDREADVPRSETTAIRGGIALWYPRRTEAPTSLPRRWTCC